MPLGSSDWSPNWSPSNWTFLCSTVISLDLSKNWGAGDSPFNLLLFRYLKYQDSTWRTTPFSVSSTICVSSICVYVILEVSEWERMLFYWPSLCANSGSYFQRFAKLALRLVHSGITHWICLTLAWCVSPWQTTGFVSLSHLPVPGTLRWIFDAFALNWSC